jgi:hypothetical protein
MALMLTLDCSSEEALRWTTKALSQAEFQVTTSFNLRTARAAHSECACPHHGTADCDCQMVVLLVYEKDALPATLLIHSSNGRSWLSLTDFPGQRPTPTLRAAISKALVPESAPAHSCD